MKILTGIGVMAKSLSIRLETSRTASSIRPDLEMLVSTCDSFGTNVQENLAKIIDEKVPIIMFELHHRAREYVREATVEWQALKSSGERFAAPIPRGTSSEIEEEESDAFKDDIRDPSPLRSDDELFEHASAPSSGPVAPKKRGRKAKTKAKKGG
jgi:hypothetical protein